MQAHAKLWTVSALMTLCGCAAPEVDGSDGKPVPRTPGAGGDLYDYVPSNGGAAAPPGRGGGPSGLGGSAGRANSAGASGSAAPTGVGGSNAGAGSGAGGNNTASGVAGSTSSADCPSLTLARMGNGVCVPRVTEYDVAKKPTSIVLGSDRRIWVDDEDGDQLLALDDSGQVVDRVSCGAGSSPRALIGGAGDAIVWYTDARSKTLVKVTRDEVNVVMPLGFEASALALGGNGEVFLTEFGKAVYRAQPEQSSLTRWESSPTDVIVMSPGNNVWFSQGSALAQLDPAAGVTDFLLSETAYASGLCLGPDSGLWFSDGFANQLVRVSFDDGSVSRTINLPTGTSPRQIITGPDGALWFAETGTNRIGRVSLKGEITHYPLPTPDSLPHALTVGADNNIWFTELISHKVGRLIPDPRP
jgi:virginiamycin B lyase